MIRVCLPIVVMWMAACGAQNAHMREKVITHAALSETCTARKRAIADSATRPHPTSEEVARFEATRDLCADLLDAIEESAGADEE
jgi:hypothetical protein